MIPVAILCGGKGSRLVPLTDACPKSCIVVDGQPFIAHQIALLQRHGYRNIVLLTGHLSDDIEAVVGNGSRFGVRVRYSREALPLGTAGAVRNAVPLLGHAFFTLYGDSYLDCDYALIEQCFHLNEMSLSTQWEGHEYGLNVFLADDVCASQHEDLSAITSHLHEKKRLLYYPMPHRYEEIGSREGLERLRDRLSRHVSAVH